MLDTPPPAAGRDPRGKSPHLAPGAINIPPSSPLFSGGPEPPPAERVPTMTSWVLFPNRPYRRRSINLLFTGSGAVPVLRNQKIPHDPTEPGKKPELSTFAAFCATKQGEKAPKSVFLGRPGQGRQLHPHPSSMMHSSDFFHLPDNLFKPAEPGSEPEPLITLFNTVYVQKLYKTRTL